MPSFSRCNHLGGYSLCLAHSFFLCSLRNQQLLMLVCRGFVLWHSAMRLAVLWIAVSPVPRHRKKYSAYHYRYHGLLRISYCLDLYSICTFQTISHCIFCISSHGELQDLQLCLHCKFNIIYMKFSFLWWEMNCKK